MIDVRTVDFLFCLGTIAAVGKEDGTTISDKQSSRTAGKATEIVDIGEVCDQQRVQIVLFEPRSKTTQAASVIHGRSVARTSCQVSGPRSQEIQIPIRCEVNNIILQSRRRFS